MSGICTCNAYPLLQPQDQAVPVSAVEEPTGVRHATRFAQSGFQREQGRKKQLLHVGPDPTCLSSYQYQVIILFVWSSDISHPLRFNERERNSGQSSGFGERRRRRRRGAEGPSAHDIGAESAADGGARAGAGKSAANFQDTANLNANVAGRGQEGPRLPQERRTESGASVAQAREAVVREGDWHIAAVRLPAGRGSHLAVFDEKTITWHRSSQMELHGNH